MKALKDTFVQLGLPEHGYRVYLYLLEHGSSNARAIAESLGMPRPSVYDMLSLLMQKGLITERNEENKKQFQVDDVKSLSRLFEDKIETLQKGKIEIDEILPSLISQSASIQPKIKFYSGAEGIRQVLADMLWHKDISTFAMWPITEMIDLLGYDYLAQMNRRRIRRHIHVQALWPHDKKVDMKEYPFLGVGEEFYRELRIAPKEMTWKMSYWSYEDKVALIASRHETFGFVIHSRDFTELMKTQFEIIWNLSQPILPQPALTDEFLRTV